MRAQYCWEEITINEPRRAQECQSRNATHYETPVSFPFGRSGSNDNNKLPESQEWETIRQSSTVLVNSHKGQEPVVTTSHPIQFGWQEWGVPSPRDKLLLVTTFTCNLNSTTRSNNQPH
jgi:hypothetical protein